LNPEREVNYPDSVQFLYSLGNEIRTAKLGLDRIRAVLDALGRPQDRCRFVHVAGTNGKGSTCAMIESGLRAAGLRTGLFTSPHLAEPTERIRIDGEPVDAARFAAAFERVHRIVEQSIEAGAIDMHTTYFETVTAMALMTFAEERTDMVVLEVGLGGRLDATNVVRPDLCVVTPIDFDHEAFLGRAIESIAAEKAGILKPGVPAVFARQRAEAAAVLDARAEEVAAPVARTSGWPIRSLELDARGSRFEAGPLRIACPLAGEHQVENAAAAALALRSLGIPDAAIQTGIAGARWPGRLERVSEDPEIILDGAHNPASARSLAAYIERFYRDRRVRLIYGAMRDKAVAEMGGILFPHAQEVILTAPRQARAAAPEALRGLVDHPNLRVAPRIEDALAIPPGDAVTFVAGSLFLVAEARALLDRPPGARVAV
jgi:dihydrofolate synthase/folylpolyglutamate synthase